MKKNENIVIFGATSTIAESIARIYSKQGSNFILVGRNLKKLEFVCEDLKIRGANLVEIIQWDFFEEKKIEYLLNKIWNIFPRVDIALIAAGTLPDQEKSNNNMQYMINQFRVNSESVIILLSALANKFVKQKRGNISVISSVAGDRGRKDNFLYGSAKAAVTVYSSGLRGRLLDHGVSVTTIKPGFVNTSMTSDLDFPTLLAASPDSVAKDIANAINKGRGEVYTPWFWKYIMIIIKLIPDSIFKKINFK